MDRLARYRSMRDFAQTPEPEGGSSAATGRLSFSCQKHAARRLHFDLRLEWQGVLLSWAVTRGPSLDPAQKRLAVRTEDHPCDYLTFEGAIPKGSYGAGTVLLWDLGWWHPAQDVNEGLVTGMLKFAILGRRMTGAWMLVRLSPKRPGDEKRDNWLLVKERDVAAGAPDTLTEMHATSVISGRSMAEIAADTPPKRPARAGQRPLAGKPQLATRRDAPPGGGGWWVEPKHDGYRAMLAIGDGGPRITTRNGHDWTDRFAALLPWAADLRGRAALIDGEVVAGLGPETFDALQAALSSGGPLAFYAFDLLHLDGKDLTGATQSERRRALEKLLAVFPPLAALRLSPIAEGPPDLVLTAICAAGGEGIVAKRIDAPYRARRTRAWIKVKCGILETFAIVGYTPSDVESRPFASLMLASFEAGGLAYRGRVGTGFDGATMDATMREMSRHVRANCPLPIHPADAGPSPVWLEPVLKAEVWHAGLTGAARIRHGVFEGLLATQPGHPARKAIPPLKTAPTRAGIVLSHPARVVFPGTRTTKLDLAEYYEAVAPAFFAHAADRPLTFLRHPGGLDEAGFYQRHKGEGFPRAIGSVRTDEGDTRGDPSMFMASAAGMVAAVQMGTIEFHLWGARRDRLDRPDRLVFDLDPDEALGFDAVKSAALDLRDRLENLGLASSPIVTGGKGIHVVVSLRRTVTWDTVKTFARTVATILARKEPERFVSTMSRKRRAGRIFVDWLRNEKGATAVAPFSVRARPGAPVAVPIPWRDLTALKGADVFGMEAARARADRPAEPIALSTLGPGVLRKLQLWIDE